MYRICNNVWLTVDVLISLENASASGMYKRYPNAAHAILWNEQ